MLILLMMIYNLYTTCLLASETTVAPLTNDNLMRGSYVVEPPKLGAGIVLEKEIDPNSREMLIMKYLFGLPLYRIRNKIIYVNRNIFL